MRPRPPDHLFDALDLAPRFEPAPELLGWAITTFIEEGAPLHNPEHGHLHAASLGFLWTNVANSRHGRAIAGQCEFKPPGGTMGKWARGRAQAQIAGWFGGLPDFLITLYAPYAAVCSDTEFCALVEHELYHAGQAKDEFEAPKFAGDSGMPVFCLRGHDVEEFTGIVRRYGAAAAHVEAFIAAAALTADVPAGSVAAVCGTCGA